MSSLSTTLNDLERDIANIDTTLPVSWWRALCLYARLWKMSMRSYLLVNNIRRTLRVMSENDVPRHCQSLLPGVLDLLAGIREALTHCRTRAHCVCFIRRHYEKMELLWSDLAEDLTVCADEECHTLFAKLAHDKTATP